LIDLNGLPDADFQAAAATRVTRDGALANARVSIQIHGGIGFTSECDAHHYLKRAFARPRGLIANDSNYCARAIEVNPLRVLPKRPDDQPLCI